MVAGFCGSLFNAGSSLLVKEKVGEILSSQF